MYLLLSSSQIESFHQDGFLVLNNFFSENEIKRFENSLRKIIFIQYKKAKKIYPDLDRNLLDSPFDDLIIKLEEIDHSFIANIYDTIYSTSSFLALSSKKEISECINQILGKEIDDPLYLDQSRCRIDTPYDPHHKKCGWHQEVFYYIPKSEFVQTWAPVIHDAKIENGTIEVCLRSHNALAKQSKNHPENEKYQFIVDPSEVKKYERKFMELKIGQLLIFNSKLIHRSGQNISKQARYSLVGINHNPDSEFFTPPKFIEVNKNDKFENYFDNELKK